MLSRYYVVRPRIKLPHWPKSYHIIGDVALQCRECTRTSCTEGRCSCASHVVFICFNFSFLVVFIVL